MEGRGGIFSPAVFDCLCFSLFVALSPLSVCHLCFATVSVYRDLAMPRPHNPHCAQQPIAVTFALFFAANTHCR